MSVSVSRIISVVFHPVFMPLYGLFLIFNSDSYLNNSIPPEAKRFLYFFVFSITVAMPALSAFILSRNKMISSIHMPLRSDRRGPYLVTIFYYLLLYFLLRRIPNIPPAMLSILLGSVLTLIFLLLFNNWIKISAHTAGIGGIVGIYMGLSSIWVIMPDMQILAGLIILTGFVASARLVLSTHTSREVYLGAIIGFLTEFVVIRNHFFI